MTGSVSINKDILNAAASGTLGTSMQWDKAHDSGSYIGQCSTIALLGQCSRITLTFTAGADGVGVRGSISVRFGNQAWKWARGKDFDAYAGPIPSPIVIDGNFNKLQLDTLSIYMSMYNLDDGSKAGLTGNMSVTGISLEYLQGPGFNF